MVENIKHVDGRRCLSLSEMLIAFGDHLRGCLSLSGLRLSLHGSRWLLVLVRVLRGVL